MSELKPEQPSCEKQQYTVGRDALPISCPMPTMTLWNAHPRVYLPIEKTGEAKCPYCGAHYLLQDGEER